MSATVLLDGRDVTGVTLDGLTITRGRVTVYDDIAPGVCVATMVSGDVDPAAWQGVSGYTDAYQDTWVGASVAARVGAKMTVTTSGASGYIDAYQDTWKGAGTLRFTGTVTAVDYSPGQLVLTAVDSLEILGRNYVTAARPAETDFSRAYSLAKQAGATLNYVGENVVSLVAQEPQSDPITFLVAMKATADNQDAQLYADTSNQLVYRRKDAAPGITVELPPDSVLTEQLSVSEELGAVYNVERVEYGPRDGRQVIERTDPASIDKYGRREWRTYSTQLSEPRDAMDLAAYWLTVDKDAAYIVRSIVAVAPASESDAWTAAADTLDLFAVARVTGLPKGSPIAEYEGVVLGYTETITQHDRQFLIHLGPPGYLRNGNSYATATTA